VLVVFVGYAADRDSCCDGDCCGDELGGECGELTSSIGIPLPRSDLEGCDVEENGLCEAWESDADEAPFSTSFGSGPGRLALSLD